MITVTHEMYRNSVELDRLLFYRQARPVGKVDASNHMMWVRSETTGNVIRIGLVVKDKVQIK